MIRQRGVGGPPYARVGQIVPGASRPANNFFGVFSIFTWIATLVLAILILIFLLQRTTAIIECCNTVSNLIQTTVITCLNEIKTLIETTVVNHLVYIRGKADAGMLMEDAACDDGNACTVDLCDTFGGCTHRPVKTTPAVTCHDYCRADPILLKRSVVPNGVCTASGQCVSTNLCKGDCPNETNEDCPELAFNNPLACSTDCTESKMCLWHCSLDIDAPWVSDVGGGTDNVWLEDDSHVELECLAFLNQTDYFTGKFVENSCLQINSQLYKVTPIRRRDSNNNERNVVVTHRAICQYHFGCSSPEPVPRIVI